MSIHSVDTPRREAFYWASVVATFALGTAVGDLTAVTFHLGYLTSGLLFAGVIAVPAFGFRWFHWNAIFSFWFAYVVTRPLGASFADWMGKPQSVGGLGWGDGTVAVALTIVIFCLVAFLAVTRADVQRAGARAIEPALTLACQSWSPRRKAPIDAPSDCHSPFARPRRGAARKSARPGPDAIDETGQIVDASIQRA